VHEGKLVDCWSPVSFIRDPEFSHACLDSDKNLKDPCRNLGSMKTTANSL
jgi:hypothetical protein